MRLLRENLFFVILIGATVGLGAVGLIYYFVSDVHAKLGSRTGLSDRLTTLSRRGEKVNESAVKWQKERIKTLAEAVKKDVAAGIAFNKTHLPLIQLRVGGVLVPAFPIDEKVYSDRGLDLLFIRKYTELLDAMIARSDLKRTRLATTEEVREQALVFKEQFGAQAEAKAKQFMRIKKARDGLIFIEDAALDRYFKTTATKASAVQLWEAQVNLWVTREVLEAIIATNHEVLEQRKQAGSPGPANVLSSPVKQLAKLAVDEALAVSTGSGMLFGARRQVGSLTNRTTTGEYGVVRYRFTVVMPPRHVEKLLRNLMRRNYHTVVNVGMGGLSRQTPYYYGIEPVMMVNIAGEMLLLSDWIRPLMPPAVKLPAATGAKTSA